MNIEKVIKFFGKSAPVILGVLIMAVLVVVLLLSSTYSTEVLAQGKKDTTQTDTTKKTDTTQKDTQTKPAEPKPTQTIDDSGNSGFVICGNKADEPCNISHLFRAFIIIINYLITMAGLVAILVMVIAGVQITTSQGEERLRQAKQRMSGAVIGLILVAIAFVGINSILAGSLNIGIKNGALILSNPKEYINQTN